MDIELVSIEVVEPCSINFYPGNSKTPITITFHCIPEGRDAEEYINEYLDGILNDFLKYNSEWEFA